MKQHTRFLYVLLTLMLFLQMGCNKEHTAGFNKPEGIYCNWSAFDELSDTVKLDEALAIRQLEELIRLRKLGIQIDYYIMDAFWFDKYGGYRLWRYESWPNGPDKWLQTCLENDIKPGLWFSVNRLNPAWLNPIPKWESSLDNSVKRLCLVEGGYLPDLIESMQMWVDRGISLIKFDFADFNAATPQLKKTLSEEEIFQKNVTAFRKALKKFRKRNPGVHILAYNGFGGQQNNTSVPFEKELIDLRWLDVFDALYCGDPRLSDVPTFNFWRSMDIYSDHQVRQYEYNGVSLSRIDNMAFMIGTTGTCYNRGLSAWKGMLILFLARGGWASTYYGNLDLITGEDARWLAKVQSIFLPFQENRAISTFGAIPGMVAPYGYLAQEKNGAVITLVNPTQSFETVDLPVSGKTRLLFTDAGYLPDLDQEKITLGPEQMAVVGVQKFADQKYELGRQEDILIPHEITRIETSFMADGKNRMTATLQIPAGKDIRIVWQQFDSDGLPVRSGKNSKGQGENLDQILVIQAEQNGKSIPVEAGYDRSLWSGLSWAAGEIRADTMNPSLPLSVTCISKDPENVEMKCRLFSVAYR